MQSVKMNETTHCIFCNTKLVDCSCRNKKCNYKYGSRSAEPHTSRSFNIDGVWYHYFDGWMRIYDTNSGKIEDFERHLTLDQVKKLQVFK